MANNQEPFWDESAMFSGFRAGLFIGLVAALFKGPRLNLRRTQKQLAEAGDKLRGNLEMVTPNDPVKQGIAEGKEIARQRAEKQGS